MYNTNYRKEGQQQELSRGKSLTILVAKWGTIIAFVVVVAGIIILSSGCVVYPYPSPYYYGGGVNVVGPYEPVYGSWGHGGGHHGGRR